MPSTARTHRAVSVATPDSRWRKFNAVRSPVRIARADPVDPHHLAALSPLSLPAQTLNRELRIERVERRLGEVKAEDHARRLLRDERFGARALRDGGDRRDIAVADVLGQRRVHDLKEGLRARRARIAWTDRRAG